MFLSQKGSLGRNPMINRVGQRLLQLFEGASAAYSLRNLASNIASVVRVRRASDNSEKDFSAADVSSGAMTQWVNGQVVPPLDVRELVDGERTGALIPAAAAYSLRNLSASYTGDVVEVRRNTDGATLDFSATEVADGTLTNWVNTSFADALPLDTASGASAAYSLRNLSTSYTGNVVDVRRSSDNAEDSFTAAEVADGTLEDWVGADYVKYSSDFTSNDNDWGHFDDVAATGAVDGIGGLDGNLRLAIGSATSPHRAYRNNTLPENQEITFSARVFIPSTNSVVDGIGLFDAAGNTIINAESLTQDQWVTVTANDVTTANSQLRINLLDGSSTSFTGNSSDVVYVREITVTQTTANGHVSQWYDQSGNANHATQGTDASQPKIVDAGVLVSGNTGEPAFTGDGVDDILSLSSSIDFGTGEFFVSTVVDVDTGGAVIGSATPNWLLLVTTSSIQARASNTNTIYVISPDSVLTAGESYLISLSRVGDDITAYVNGVAQADVETVVSTDTFSANRFLQRGTNNNPYSDPVSEIIIYASDQSDKRQAIEENIGSNYGITVTSSKDGTVSTWYDQSGNANHATQTDAASQPKIVDAGTLVSGGLDFDGVDDSFTLTSGLTINPSTSGFSSFIATKFDKAATGSAQVFLRNNNSNPKHAISFNTSGTFRYNLNDGTNNLFADTGSDYGDNSLSLFSTIITGQSATGLTHFVDGSQDGQFDTSLIGDTGSTADTISWPAFPFGGVVQEIIFYPSDQSDNRTAFEANIGETYGIDLPSGVDTGYDQVDGFVETWYDQSGNGNDAVQETAGSQPKIVDAGVLVTGGLDFDGSATNFKMNSEVTLGTEFYVAGVMKLIAASSETNATILGPQPSGGDRLYLSTSNNKLAYRNSSTNFNTTLNPSGTEVELVSYTSTLSNITVSLNGTDSVNVALTASMGAEYIGGGGYISGSMTELIIYPSDQSANRAAIETNINNQYDIY